MTIINKKQAEARIKKAFEPRSGYFEITSEKILKRRDKDLFHAALLALKGEDRLLRKQFESANRKWYRKENHGLAYWLYETTLVYTIFKAWIPRVNVVWDWPLPGSKGRSRPDLHVLTDDGTRAIFEAKWCNSRYSNLRQVVSQAQQQQEKEKKAAAYVIAFWCQEYSDGGITEDVQWIGTQVEKHRVTCVYFGGFPTQMAVHVSHAKKREDHRTGSERARPLENAKSWYFALAAFRVNAA